MRTLITIAIDMAPLIPMTIVWVIGVTLALSRWRRHPQVSQFALIAFTLLITTMGISRGLAFWISRATKEGQWSTAEVGSIFVAIGIVSGLIYMIAWALILCAIFGWRNQSQKEFLSFPAQPAVDNEQGRQTAPPGFHNND